MSKIKLIITVACLSLLFVDSAWAQPGWGYHRRFYYGPPVYAYPPVVAFPPPVVVGPPPAYLGPPPAYVAPGPIYPPPAYTYGMIGPRGGYGFGYASPGFGVYIGR
jgi:hypothetical protein